VDGGSATAPITRDLYSERRKVEAAVSTVPLVWGPGLVGYLDDYEYSCTEQLVSKGMAALVLISRPEFGTIRNRTDRPLDPTYATLRGRMNDTGGLCLWAATPDTAEFATVYAAHFLVEAKERGHDVPQDVLASLDGWLTRFAATPASTLADARLRAYAVYVLARQGIRPAAALSSVEQELTHRYPQAWPTDLAAAYLAATYRLMQRSDEAARIVRGVPWSSQKRDFGGEIYYNGVVHDAQLLYLLARHFPTVLGSTPPAALETIGAAVSGNRATSLSAGYTLLALDAVARTTSTTAAIGVSEIGRDGRERTLSPTEGAIGKADVSASAAKVLVTRRGTVPAYFALTESGFDRQAPSADLGQGLEVFREFLDMKGSPVTRVSAGEDFLVRLRIRSTGRDFLPQIAVVDLLPGGVEPVLELQPAPSSSQPGSDPSMAARNHGGGLRIGLLDRSDWRPTHVDVRDDRLVLYGDVTKSVGTFIYRVRADNAGVYQVPPVFAEGMYDRMVFAQSRAATIEVIRP
jgi:uncharacterized protein YfaS (alpha-2-macroglobulin family)